MIFKKYSLLVSLLIALTASGCSRTPAEEAILENIKSMQRAAEDKKSRKAVECIDDAFLGNRGIDKMSLRRIMAGAFIRHKNITIAITRMEVNVNQQDPFSATMNGVVVLSGAENILPQDGRIYKVSGDWQYKDGEWLLVRANWE